MVEEKHKALRAPGTQKKKKKSRHILEGNQKLYQEINTK